MSNDHDQRLARIDREIAAIRAVEAPLLMCAMGELDWLIERDLIREERARHLQQTTEDGAQ